MNNPWKLATIGLALTGVTALSTGLTTAYVLRPISEGAGSQAFATPAPVVSQPDALAQWRPQRWRRRPVAPSVVRTAAVQTAADDCSTGGQRAMKIAKPGAIGALTGAGLGAIGGALADGGKAAGKGALIGGIAGAALGGGYGAYKTKQECGTIFGVEHRLHEWRRAGGRSRGRAERGQRHPGLHRAIDARSRITCRLSGDEIPRRRDSRRSASRPRGIVSPHAVPMERCGSRDARRSRPSRLRLAPGRRRDARSSCGAAATRRSSSPSATTAAARSPCCASRAAAPI